MKRVRVTLEVDEEFVKLLNLNVCVQTGGYAELEKRDVTGVLAGVVLLEARGALPEQIHAAIPPAWRPHIEVISENRLVKSS